MSRGALLDIRVRTGWKRGPACTVRGPLLVSFTVFVPKTVRDIPRIYVAAERLREACRELEGAAGVATWWQPLRRRVGSLSAWESEDALRRFIALPYHREIMRRYRRRGTVIGTRWHVEAFDLRTAFRDGFRSIDAPLRTQPA